MAAQHFVNNNNDEMTLTRLQNEDDAAATSSEVGEGTKSGKEKVMEWLRSNSSEILFSSSVESCSPPQLIIITDDEGEDSTSQPDVISISSIDEMEAMVSGLDRIRDRSEAMRTLKISNNFYKALEVASVQYACDEVARIMNLTDDKECYIPWSNLVMHILRWLAIEATAKCGNMQWRHDLKELISNGLRQLRRSYEEEVEVSTSCKRKTLDTEDDDTREVVVVVKKRRDTSASPPSSSAAAHPHYYGSPPASQVPWEMGDDDDDDDDFEFSPASPPLTQMTKREEEEEEEEEETSPPMLYVFPESTVLLTADGGAVRIPDRSANQPESSTREESPEPSTSHTDTEVCKIMIEEEVSNLITHTWRT
ncbi:hypothetical protein LSAT2_029882 [Lamellibrachia satsuma]|nr:hypothetical protein LSAT2_029882 [Lamellibrachia satsuma]